VLKEMLSRCGRELKSSFVFSVSCNDENKSSSKSVGAPVFLFIYLFCIIFFKCQLEVTLSELNQEPLNNPQISESTCWCYIKSCHGKNTDRSHSKKCWVVSTQIWVKYGQTQMMG